ncbi:DUF3182 family protein [Streptomyces nigra]|uniref:DUF3182 family protein n=1 Tax=Streptomyces nigra TaxID=1827580 RepID=UPI00362FF20C
MKHRTSACEEQLVFLYRSPEDETDYFTERNIELAKRLALLTGRRFVSEFRSDLEEAPPDAFWFLHGPITPVEARLIGLRGQDFFGGVAERIHAQKSVFHTPLRGSSAIPETFPSSFTNYLLHQGILLPGYTAFTRLEAREAFERLQGAGYRVRFKSALGAGGKGHGIVDTRSTLESKMSRITESELHTYGVVLEANVIGPGGVPPESLSGGWIEVDGRTYSYVGRMSFIPGSPRSDYVGTEIYIGRGSPDKLRPPTYRYWLPLLRMLCAFREANRLLPSFTATRCNYNFVRGYLDHVVAHRQERDTGVVIGATEPTFRAGGATSAELLGMEFLDNNLDVELFHLRSQQLWGKDVNVPAGQNVRVIYEGLSTGKDGIPLPASATVEIIGSRRSR